MTDQLGQEPAPREPVGLRLGRRVGRPVTIFVDGEPLPAWEGESVAAALLAAGRRAWRWTSRRAPRGYFCGVGLCADCLMVVDGEPDVRVCLVPVRDGLRVETGRPGLGGPRAPGQTP